MQKTKKSLNNHAKVTILGALMCLVAVLVFTRGNKNLVKFLSSKTPTGVPVTSENTTIPTLTKVVAIQAALPAGSEAPSIVSTAQPSLYAINQPEFNNENWFGRNKFYGNAEDAQSFRIEETSELREIALHLAYRPGGNNERPVRCSLMDAEFNILAETEIAGFQDDPGWKTFRFDPGIVLQPGTYIFSVFTQGSYFLRFTDNPRSYSAGERYTRTWKDTGWEVSDGDLSFSIYLTKE